MENNESVNGKQIELATIFLNSINLCTLKKAFWTLPIERQAEIREVVNSPLSFQLPEKNIVESEMS